MASVQCVLTKPPRPVYPTTR
eukprot:COSAG01_NODE_30010_length_625_cov_0.830798_1_plen_20_part_10